MVKSKYSFYIYMCHFARLATIVLPNLVMTIAILTQVLSIANCVLQFDTYSINC